MSTTVYGHSDDCIEVEGDVTGEVAYSYDKDGVLLVFSDGTLIVARYHKPGIAVWELILLNRGTLFNHIECCQDEDADLPSDVVYFNDGLTWAFSANDWNRIK